MVSVRKFRVSKQNLWLIVVPTLAGLTLVGCRHPPPVSPARPLPVPPAGPLNVYAAPKLVKLGMSEEQVRAVLGKPRTASTGTVTSEGHSDSFTKLIYWNPAQGYHVAEISLHNDKVVDIEEKTYPR